MGEDSGRMPVEAKSVTGLAVHEGSGRGTELIGREDVLMPRIQLDGKAGGFRSVGTETTFAQIRITPIFFWKSQILFGDQDDGEPSVLCRSNNAIYPADWDGQALQRYGMANPAPECNKCDFNRWSKDAKTGQTKAPRCRLCYNILAFVHDLGGVYVCAFHGTSISALKPLLTTSKQGSLDFWARTWALGTKKAGEGTKTYHALEVIESVATDEDELKKYAQIYSEAVGDNPLRAVEVLSGGRSDASSVPPGPAPGAAAAEGEKEEVPF